MFALKALNGVVPGFEKAKLRNFGMTIGTRDSRDVIMNIYYRVFTAIGKQEGGCYKLILTLLRAQRASMSPQDWAQITFRSEMHLNDFNN